jgi:hypothetical protein
MKYVVNAIPDNWPMALHLSEGSVHTIQCHNSYMGYRILNGMNKDKVNKPMPSDSLVYTGHYIDHEIVQGIEADWTGGGFQWYISGYDAYKGLVWLNRRNTDPITSRDTTLLYCFNRHTQTLTEVTTRTANDPVTFDHERFVEPVHKRAFWLSKAIEPTTGRMMIYLQFGFPTGDGDVNNIPKPVYDTDHWDFEMGCYKYIPKVRPTPEFNGLLGFKATDGHWKVAEVDINAFYRV